MCSNTLFDYQSYVFSKHVNLVIKETFLEGFVDCNETSCTKVIEDIRDNKYKFKTTHKLVIVFSTTQGKYYLLTKKYNYLYLISKILSDVNYTVLKSYNSSNPDENMTQYIEDYKFQYIMKNNIYTMVIDNTFKFKNSIYNIFNVTNLKNVFIDKENNIVNIPSLNQILNLMINVKNENDFTYPFVCNFINSVGFDNKNIIFSFHKQYLDTIYWNIVNNIQRIFDTTLLSNVNKFSQNEYLVQKFGFENFIVLQNISHFNLRNIYNSINKSEFYITITVNDIVDVQFGIHLNYYTIYIARKSEYNKYINNSRYSIILSRFQRRTEQRNLLLSRLLHK